MNKVMGILVGVAAVATIGFSGFAEARTQNAAAALNISTFPVYGKTKADLQKQAAIQCALYAANVVEISEPKVISDTNSNLVAFTACGGEKDKDGGAGPGR